MRGVRRTKRARDQERAAREGEEIRGWARDHREEERQRKSANEKGT